ncbi:polysaccharide biosynthesis protein [Cytobacillus praedii]|uniref:polysaccharide biosynthesis protein n=1 Tax=Cytobacillus praedii TaxID=1742358 RepID=UPI003F7F28D3
MPYLQRLLLLLSLDSLLIVAAIMGSQFLLSPYTAETNVMASAIILQIIFYKLFSMKYKLYKKVWEYASIEELIAILKVVTFSFGLVLVIESIILQELLFRSFFVSWLLLLSFVGGSRFYWRISRHKLIGGKESRKKVLIIGAGSAGIMVVRQLQNNKDASLFPIAFIDDDRKKHHRQILGVPVVGDRELIEHTVKGLGVEHIIIAIPSLDKKDLNTIFQECMKTNVKTQILPLLEDLVTGKLSVNQFRDVQVEDLLGREEVEIDIESISGYITNKVVLVTGAGGSIGSEICRQIVQFTPGKIILLGHGENSIYSIEMELRKLCEKSAIQIATVIADIQDERKMNRVMGQHSPDVVYHAAAHKHVPLMEQNPEEAVKNNMIGTLNVAMAASIHHVSTFVMVSSDKAVNPTSVMGATKRLAEMIIQDMNQKSQTKFLTVRFGNVLGSRGSVIPLFKKQIKEGGPVTVTHPDMVRYFMTIPEASRLVIQAGSLANGGETFVLDMGSPIKIVDLAKSLIIQSGKSIGDIGIVFSGMRHGEKLYEELFYKDEIHEQQVYPKIYTGKLSPNAIMPEIEELLLTFTTMHKDQLRETLLRLANKEVVEEKILSVTH